MKKRFKNKVVVVTGGANGIGKEVSLSFAQEGANVIIVDINNETAEETVKEINDDGGKAVYILCDVSDPQDVKELFKNIEYEYEKLDYAFNNAGIIPAVSEYTADYDYEIWNKVININLTGVWLCMKNELAMMKKKNKGVIVNCSSVLGQVGFPSGSPYVASKHGVIGLTKTAAIEYAESGIRVNAVCPGFIDTGMLENIEMGPGQKFNQSIIRRHPMKRLGYAEEVSNAVLWLCSNEASFITGASINVDGGYTAQ